MGDMGQWVTATGPRAFYICWPMTHDPYVSSWRRGQQAAMLRFGRCRLCADDHDDTVNPGL